MTYALDDCFRRAINDDAVKVIVLCSTGKHFSAGHDIGTPGRDVTKSFEHKHLWWDHTNNNRVASSSLCARAGSLFEYVPALARDAQADHRHGPGRLYRRRPDAGLGV